MTSNNWDINEMHMRWLKTTVRCPGTTVRWIIKIKHCSFEYNINNSQFFYHEMNDMRWLAKLLEWHVETWVERLLWDDD